jgi:hypothetical protein
LGRRYISVEGCGFVLLESNLVVDCRKRFSCWKGGGGEKEQIAMALAVAPVSRLSSAHSIYISHTSMSYSNRYLNLAFSSSSKHASSQASLMTEYSFSSRRVVARSPQAAMATISQNAHRIAYTMANLKVQGKVIVLPNPWILSSRG